jgi:lipopolysaccharide export system protein LptC
MMRLPYKNWVMTLLLLMALAGSVWLMQQSFLRGEEVNISQPTTPDAFMTDMTYTSFDAAGSWGSHLQAARITHYADQDTSVIASPKMISRSGPLTWIVTAAHGTARQGLKTIHLEDHVQVDRMHATKGKTLTLQTSALTAYPQRKWAETDKPVTIIQPNSVVYATGLTADMQAGDIHLLSDVKGTYDSHAK